MQTASQDRAAPLEVAAWAIFGLVIAGWLAILFLHQGQLWDEAEHAHAAWLVSQGKRPLDDFFEHHQPLLWSLLALYYRAGFRGPGVLIWGRVLVVISGLVSVLALLRFASLHRSSPRPIAGWLGIAAFVDLTLLLPRLFVSRPETISAAALLAALAIWNERTEFLRSFAAIVLAGVLAGAACYSSPRFALLGGLFLLSGKQTFRRWIAMALGAVIFVAVYTIGSGFSLDKVVFNLEFSALLQTVGNGIHVPMRDVWPVLLVSVCSFSAALLPLLPRVDRLRGMLLISNMIAVWLICAHFAGNFRYSQAFAPFVVSVAVSLAWFGARTQCPDGPYGVLSLIAAAVFLVNGLSSPQLRGWMPQLDFLQSVRFRERLAASVPSGGTALVFTGDSPITVPDASYYGIPLADGQNRLCRAIEEFRGRWKLPPCDFLKVLVHGKPYLTDKHIWRAVPPSEESAAKRILRSDYRRVIVRIGSSSWRTGIMRRLDGAEPPVASFKPSPNLGVGR